MNYRILVAMVCIFLIAVPSASSQSLDGNFESENPNGTSERTLRGDTGHHLSNATENTTSVEGTNYWENTQTVQKNGETGVSTQGDSEGGTPPMNSPTQNTTYYVSTSGSDENNDGVSWENAFATIQQAIDEASKGDIIIIGDGTFAENVNVHKESLTILSDNGALKTTIQTPNSDDSVFEVIADNVTISGFTVENATRAALASGIYLNLVDNCNISNNILRKNYYGIHLGNVHSGNSNYNKIENNIAKNNRSTGVYLRASSNNTLDNNACRKNGHGIYLYLNSDNNILSNNLCSNNSFAGLKLHLSDNNSLDNNVSTNNCDGIRLVSSRSTKMRNNKLSNNQYNFDVSHEGSSYFIHDVDTTNSVGGEPIYYLVDNRDEVIGPSPPVGYLALVNCENILVKNLVLKNNRQGILLAFTENTRVSNCTFRKNEEGIYLWHSNNNILSKNICSNNQKRGILLGRDSDNNALDNNACTNNSNGIELISHSDKNILSRNVCKKNSDSGISLKESNNNFLNSNKSNLNRFAGIYISQSSNNTIFNNACENNRGSWGYAGGITLTGSENNLIHHNDFLNNGKQAYDDGPNHWDNGYPSGGNYWSDYTGKDNYRGKNQDIPGGDGIGDSPYKIPEDDGLDRYPLMEPWTTRPSPDTTPPEVTISSPENISYCNTGEPVHIDYTVEDDRDPDPETELYLDGQLYPSESINLGVYSGTTEHTLRVEATDSSGNTGSNSVTFKVVPANLKGLRIKFAGICWASLSSRKDRGERSKSYSRRYRKDRDKFSTYGSFELADGFRPQDLNNSARLQLKITDKLGRDRVNFRKSGNFWLYRNPEQKEANDGLDQGIDIKSMLIYWIPGSARKWFYVRGELSLEGVNVNTQPPKATIALKIPLKPVGRAGSLAGKETIEFRKYSRSWLYR